MVESPTPLVGTSQFTHYMPRVSLQRKRRLCPVNPLPFMLDCASWVWRKLLKALKVKNRTETAVFLLNTDRNRPSLWLCAHGNCHNTSLLYSLYYPPHDRQAARNKECSVDNAVGFNGQWRCQCAR